MPINDQRTAMRSRFLIVLLVLICVCVLIFSNYEKSKKIIVYDCDTAIWYSDIPVEVKNECKRLIYEELMKQKEIESKKQFI